MWLGILLVIAAIGIGLAIGIPRGQQIAQLRKDGAIVQRSMRYAEKGEQFTSKIGTYTALRDQIQNMRSPCSMDGNVSSTVNFNAANFAARLCMVDFDQQSGVGIFRFEFTRWKNGRYTYVDDHLMNMLMTSVEKAFLALDPNTGVQTYNINFKTKHSIF